MIFTDIIVINKIAHKIITLYDLEKSTSIKLGLKYNIEKCCTDQGFIPPKMGGTFQGDKHVKNASLENGI